MFVSVTILSLFVQIDNGVSVRGCLPNSKFYVNGKFCQCDRTGRWDENSCNYLTSQSNCYYGQIIWRGCMRCVCQMNGELACSNHNCSEKKFNVRPLGRSGNKSAMKLFSLYGPRCSPLSSFSIDCQMCICPASGRTLDIRCILKPACLSEKALSLSDIRASDKRTCLPKVIYIFQCLQCLCSEQGHFNKERCIDICKTNDKTKDLVLSKCKPQSFYKNQCNVCYCPNDGIPNSKLCTNSSCSKSNKYSTIVSMQCKPYTFTKQKCIYCDCNTDGSVNEDDCLEAACLPTHPTYHTDKFNCSPGEIVQICAECICPRNGHTLEKFCTKTCDIKSKNAMLENILTNNTNDLIDLKEIPNDCLENSMCVENGRLCFSFNTNTKLCTAQVVNQTMFRKHVENISGHGSYAMNIGINMSGSCEPNTFVDFDCNTCFCSKFGTIDPKWCTYDDCEKKKHIQRSNSCERHPDTCQPGSITQENCSFCICPESGISKDRKCTVSNNHTNCAIETFLCEPLSYYTVDCNVCYCPRDGFKNVAQCTKKVCEKNFLKTRACVPGQLFSEECNICICASNGIKSNEACTNHSCSEFVNRKIFDTDGNEIKDETQPLGHCFPGEEFEVGCKLCICPDMGLKEFAACVPEVCPEEEYHNYNIRRNFMDPIDTSSIIEIMDTLSVLPLHRRTIMESCKTYNLTLLPERIECTPGTMYFIRCRMCICPYMGNINNYCRPLPDGVYCEQAYPNFNFLPMGRRNNTLREANKKTQEFQGQPIMKTTNIVTEHFHTKYNCTKQGFLLDACFICECDENYVVIEEHCFKSDAKECIDAEKPTFLGDA